MDENQYRIGELAEKAGVTRRTVHYYLAKGLLPPSMGEGLGTTYSDEHLFRIILIKKLQDNFLPLDEIKRRLDEMTLYEVRESIEHEVLPKAAGIKSKKTDDKETISGSGTTYKRIVLGFGVELHYPAGNGRAQDLADKITEFAQKIMKEG